MGRGGVECCFRPYASACLVNLVVDGAAPKWTRRLKPRPGVPSAVDYGGGVRGPLIVLFLVGRLLGELERVELRRRLIVDKEYRAALRVVGADDKSRVRRIYRLLFLRDILANAIGLKLGECTDWIKSKTDIDRRGSWVFVFQIRQTSDIDDEPRPVRLDITHGVIDRVGVHIRCNAMNEFHPRIEYVREQVVIQIVERQLDPLILLKFTIYFIGDIFAGFEVARCVLKQVFLI